MSFYVSTATFFLLHCDECDRVVALPRHKFVTGATLLQLMEVKSWFYLHFNGKFWIWLFIKENKLVVYRRRILSITSPCGSMPIFNTVDKFALIFQYIKQCNSSSSGCSAKPIKYSRTFEWGWRLCTVQVKRIKTVVNLNEIFPRQLSLEAV